MSFATAVKEFVAVSIANAAIVVGAHFLLRRDESIHLGAALFFLFLTSIIIALFDHYRPLYLRRVAAEHAASVAA